MRGRRRRLLFLNQTPADPYAAYLIYDSFTGANGTHLHSHTPEKAPAGSVWAEANGGPFSISGNKARNAQANDQLSVIDSGEADIDLVVGAVILGSELGCLIRGSGGALNGWLFLCSCARDAYELYMMDGAYNLIDSDAAVLTPGDALADLELRATGTLIEGLVNGVVKVSTNSATYQAQTYVGLFCYGDDGTAKWDDLTVE
jgi:hypothetical protein